MAKTYPMVCCLALSMLLATPAASQPPPQQPPSKQQPAGADSEMQKLAEDYTAAWNKGDAKAVAALHARDAIQITPDGRVNVGRAEIEKSLQEAFAGPSKGARLTVRMGRTSQISADVRTSEGTYEITGMTAAPAAKAPGATRGRFLNTIVREGGRWLIASSAIIPEQSPAPAR